MLDRWWGIRNISMVCRIGLKQAIKEFQEKQQEKSKPKEVSDFVRSIKW